MSKDREKKKNIETWKTRLYPRAENDQSATPVKKALILELDCESREVVAVEMVKCKNRVFFHNNDLALG
ncbi:hypothetical protein TorRG33x02_002730 [Trema orientale]|uniref:Uncharacterized protein n=1 Tax=Trema orientale TaxID=63057 RepID=A0A2P5G1S4_TREOI|nr:hypothetical protein TorRG33x02_002730 [Trema orientale]